MAGRTLVARERANRRSVKQRSSHGKATGRAATVARLDLARVICLYIGKIVQRLPGSKLRPIKSALDAKRPMKALALIAAELRQSANEDTVIEEALVRGARLKEELVEKSGGLLISKRVSELIGISPQALHKRMAKGGLIAVGLASGDLGYPAFQFESEAMQSGVAELLKAIGVDDPWPRLAFMFLRLDELGGETPVDAVRAGRVKAAVLAARHHGEHGAS
jgi:hypothetical protein